MVELDLLPTVWAEKTALFEELWGALSLSKAYCFSFDSLLLGLCVERKLTASVDGLLFRRLLDEQGPAPRPKLTLRPGRASDAALILPHREGVFETEAEVHQYLQQERITVLERSGTFLGVGLVTPVWPARRERDLGVLVHPDHRGQGYATFLLRTLKRRCLDQGLRPTAGCAASNVSSWRAIISAGFASEHSLFAFEAAE